MTSSEAMGIVDTATKSFKLAGKAAASRSYREYFVHINAAEDALRYVQMECADDLRVYHAIEQLKRVIEEHRECTCEEMALVAKASGVAGSA